LKTSQSYATGVVFVLLATIGWSMSGLFVRFLPSLNGFELNCWRGFWTGVSLLCYLVLIHGNKTWEVFRAIPLFVTVMSAFCFAFGSTMYVTSLTLVSTAVISVIGATSPLFTAVMSPWITGEKPNWVSWIAAVLAVGGMFIIARDGLAAGHWLGLLTSIMVPLTFALQTLLLRRYRHVDMSAPICIGGFAAFLGAGLAGFVFHDGGGFNVPLREIGVLAIMGLVQLAIPLIFYAKGAKSVTAISLSLISMLDAVLNPLWPWLFVNEQPGQAALIGGSVILAAVFLSIFGSLFQRA
jgi:DME family drug/metabolite transporter